MRSRGAWSGLFRRIRRYSVLAFVALATWALGTILGLIPPLLVPPAILPRIDHDPKLERGPPQPGTERVQLVTDGGKTLRGIFVSSDPGAPVVLHLLESSGSVTRSWSRYSESLDELSDLGFASLVLDYRGVGDSDGERSPANIADDAWAMWCEAVKRTGGNPDRVVVRGLSIGTLAAASLADRGAHPAAWVLITPVRGETVVENFLASRAPRIVAGMLASFFRPVTDVDLLESVGKMGPRLFVGSPEDDFLLLLAEQTRLEVAVRQAGGAWSTHGSDHVELTLEAHTTVLPGEIEILRAAFPDWPDRRARASALLEGLPSEIAGRFPIGSEPRSRLEELVRANRSTAAVSIAAVALAVEDPALANRLERHVQRDHWLQGLEFEDAARVLDMEDPAGVLSWPMLEAWLRGREIGLFFPANTSGAAHTPLWGEGVDGAVEIARISETEAASGLPESHVVFFLLRSGSLRYPCCDTWRELLVDRKLNRHDARRQVVRLILKAMSIPDRLHVSPEENLELQAREGGEWRTVALDWPEPSDSGSRAGDEQRQSR